jgi:CheY-like chemotaxis protein
MARPRVDGVQVLGVDDAPSVLDVVTEILEENGAVVTAVDFAEAALEALQRKRPTYCSATSRCRVRAGIG